MKSIDTFIFFFQCGYFKRNRPKQESCDEATKPLHSNGRSNGHSSNGTNGRSYAYNGSNGHSFNKPLYPGDEAL